MSIEFIIETQLGKLTEKKILTLILNLDCSRYTLLGWGFAKFFESRNRWSQKIDPFFAEHVAKKILLAFESNSSIFSQESKMVKFSASYQDIYIYFSLFLNTINNQLSLDMDYDNWRRDFRRSSEDYMYDNARYARLFLDVVEPFVLKDFTIKCENQYLNEELPKNCLAAAIRIGDGFSKQFVDNILYSKFLITYKQGSEKLPKINDIKHFIREGFFTPTFYIRTQQSALSIAKIVVPRYENHIFLYPLEPYRMKKFEDEEGIDMQYYLRILLNICNHYPIWELRTNFK